MIIINRHQSEDSEKSMNVSELGSRKVPTEDEPEPSEAEEGEHMGTVNVDEEGAPPITKGLKTRRVGTSPSLTWLH